jgi:hypothetical protein
VLMLESDFWRALNALPQGQSVLRTMTRRMMRKTMRPQQTMTAQTCCHHHHRHHHHHHHHHHHYHDDHDDHDDHQRRQSSPHHQPLAVCSHYVALHPHPQPPYRPIALSFHLLPFLFLPFLFLPFLLPPQSSTDRAVLGMPSGRQPQRAGVRSPPCTWLGSEHSTLSPRSSGL